jgi:hypothetical protein
MLHVNSIFFTNTRISDGENIENNQSRHDTNGVHLASLVQSTSYLKEKVAAPV